MNINNPHSRKQLLILGMISLIVLAGAAVLGGFLAGALTTSLNNQPSASLETMQNLPSTQLVPSATATAQTKPTPIRPTSTPLLPPTPTLEPTASGQSSPTVTDTNATPIVSPTVPVLSFFEGPLLITMSVQGRPLHAYRFGTGPSTRAIIGAIHGGYEWNTTTLISRTMNLLRENPEWVPSNVTLYMLPIMNPDGYAAGTDAVVARMNGNLVDLNRNWDYQWQMTATHGTRPVKAGTAPFSEPETRGIRDFIFEKNIEAVIFYHSALGVVFHGANTEESLTYPLTQMLSDATGYPIQEGISGQITTGDAIDYLSDVGVAGTEIELSTHAEVDENEFQRNINGLKAFLLWVPEIVTTTAVPDVTIDAGAWVTYTLQEGDTLSALALTYGTSVEQLQQHNGLSDEDELYAGEDILVPKLNE